MTNDFVPITPSPYPGFASAQIGPIVSGAFVASSLTVRWPVASVASYSFDATQIGDVTWKWDALSKDQLLWFAQTFGIEWRRKPLSRKVQHNIERKRRRAKR